jgi:hypothetical protein
MTTADETVPIAEVDGKQFAFEAGRINSKPALAIVATIVLFLVKSLLDGFDSSRVLVIGAALLSLPSLFLYPLLTPRNGARPRSGFLPMAVALGSVVAYGLGCYLTFYEGLWSLLRLFSDFGFSSLLWSLTCCILGFVIVNGMYRLTEMCRAVDEGRIVVRSSP